MVEALLVVGGLLLGFAVPRWWALTAAAVVAVWIAVVTDVDEVPHWFLGLAYGVLSGAGIAGGVALRRSGFARRGGMR